MTQEKKKDKKHEKLQWSPASLLWSNFTIFVKGVVAQLLHSYCDAVANYIFSAELLCSCCKVVAKPLKILFSAGGYIS